MSVRPNALLPTPPSLQALIPAQWITWAKFSREVLPTAAALERTQRELRQLQRAGNPHIVKIIDFGKTPEGRLFIASELATVVIGGLLTSTLLTLLVVPVMYSLLDRRAGAPK